MATTYSVEQIGQRIRARNPEAMEGFTDAQIGERAVQRNPDLKAMVATAASSPTPAKTGGFGAPAQSPEAAPEEQDGFLKSTAKGLIRPFGKFAVSLGNVAQATGALIKGEGAAAAEKKLNQSQDLPFLGKTEPALMGDDTNAEGIKKILGTGLEIGSTVAGGGGAVGVGKTAAKGAIMRAGFQGLKVGAAGGAAGAAGAELEEGGGVIDAAREGIKGAGLGAAGGAILGAAGGTFGKLAPRLIKGSEEAVTTAVGKPASNFGRQSESVIPKVAEKAKGAIETAKSFGATAKDLGERAAEYASGIPERTAINMAERNAQKEIVRALPKPAQEAVRSGILTRDAQLFTTATPEERTILKTMAKEAAEYSENRTARDPAMSVGHELRSRVVEMDRLREEQGKKLGDYIKNVPREKLENPQNAVVERMREVTGLDGIKINAEGDLDFSDTSLSGSLTKSDREAIQNAFTDIKDRDSLQLHKYRQELFEVLGGKKSAKIEMTDTQDKALEAIRQGLADVLEKANGNYRKLNQEYAKTAGPLKEMRRFFKGLDRSGEDILDMKAGILARRLTSNMQSNPEIRNIIQTMENHLAEKGVKFNTKIDTLQEFLNALSRYYDITHDTSLAGQVNLGTGGIASTLKEAALRETRGLVGKTDAVRRKAIETLLNSLE